MSEPKSIYYNWNQTLTYSNALITMVVSARGFGKTYGIRKQAVKDFLKDGSRFCEVVRWKNELKGDDAVQAGYFDKLVINDEFPGYEFKIEGTRAYIARSVADGEKPKWQLIGYFVALSGMQKSKKRTFTQVRKVIFDEFVIDKRTRMQYLAGEVDLFINLLDTLARQEVGKETQVRAYLLGNACDLSNPYFVRYGINQQPKDGFHWYNGKTVLLHYATSTAYAEGKRKTLVGRLVAGTREESIIVGNEFAIADAYDIQKKPSTAKYQFGIRYLGTTFGLWLDFSEGYYYVTAKAPNTNEMDIIALTREDNTANVIMARKNDRRLRSLMDLYYGDCLRFESVGLRESFLNSLHAFGIM